MRVKLPAILITLFLILTLVPIAFAQDETPVDDPIQDPIEEPVDEPIEEPTEDPPVEVALRDSFYCAYLLPVEDDGETDDPEAVVSEDGAETDPEEILEPVYIHPVAFGISDRYVVEYDDVMTWFCSGDYGFGEIMLALETSKYLAGLDPAVELTPDEILALKLDQVKGEGGAGWGAVWKALITEYELDITGRPKTDEWTGSARGSNGETPAMGGVGPSNTTSPKKQGSTELPVEPDEPTEAVVTSTHGKAQTGKGK